MAQKEAGAYLYLSIIATGYTRYTPRRRRSCHDGGSFCCACSLAPAWLTVPSTSRSSGPSTTASIHENELNRRRRLVVAFYQCTCMCYDSVP